VADDLAALLGKRNPGAFQEARLIAFDLLALNRADLRPLPLRERRKPLQELLGRCALVFEPCGRGWRSAVPARLRDEPRGDRLEADQHASAVWAVLGVVED